MARRRAIGEIRFELVDCFPRPKAKRSIADLRSDRRHGCIFGLFLLPFGRPRHASSHTLDSTAYHSPATFVPRPQSQQRVTIVGAHVVMGALHQLGVGKRRSLALAVVPATRWR